MNAIPMEHGLALAGVLFSLGLIGLMVRRNILFVLMSLEVMMNATALAFVVAGSRWAQPDGQVMFILVITLAAAEGQYRSGDPVAVVSPLQHPRCRRCQRDARMNLLFLTCVFPLLGWFLLAFSRGRISENQAALIGVGSVGLSALTAAWVMVQFNLNPPEDGVFTQVLWQWMNVGGFAPSFTLYLDGLSLTMLGVVTGVGFLIHLFASWYMRGEAGYSRFFAYTNLFIFSMLLLVLGDNLLVLYFGWEGVGLCSYLLIGFYFKHRGQRQRGAEGLYRHPHRRRVYGHRPVYSVPPPRHPEHSGADGAGAAEVRGRGQLAVDRHPDAARRSGG